MTDLITELTHYTGTLPIFLKLLLTPSDLEVYDNNLKKKGVYDKVYDEYYAIRLELKRAEDKEEYRVNQYKSWVKDNPSFKKLIKEWVAENDKCTGLAEVI